MKRHRRRRLTGAREQRFEEGIDALTPEQRRQLLEHFDHVNGSEKTIDAMTPWYKVLNRPTGRLEWQAALRLGGVLGGGTSVRFATPVDAWENDVYGQLEVRMAFLPRAARLNPVEWRPKRPHSNTGNAPEGHAFLTHFDRWHPWELNKDQDVGVFLQGAVGVAAGLPSGINDFSAYLKFCAIVWKCPDIENVPPPPWSRNLL
jgi:hypothetical protein